MDNPETGTTTPSGPDAEPAGSPGRGGRPRGRRRPRREGDAGRRPRQTTAEASAAEAPSLEALEEPGPRAQPLREMPPIGMSAPTSGSLRLDPEANVYLITAGQTTYRVRLGPEAAESGLLAIDGRLGDGEWFPLLVDAGMFYRTGEGAVLPPPEAASIVETREFRHSARGRILTLRYTETIAGRALRRTLILRLVGRSLCVTINGTGAPGSPHYCGFTLGRMAASTARELRVPGLLDPLFALPGGAFATAYLDRWLGSCTASPPGGAFYRPNTAGRAEPVSETFYLTFGRDPLDGLPAVPPEPAPCFEDVVGRAFLDVWSDAPYASDAAAFERLSRCGLDDLVVTYRNWQQFGYRRRLPVHYPAARERGTNEQFRRMVAEAGERGWRFALAEEYATITPDSPYWDPRVVAKGSDGLLRASPEGGFAIAADRMVEFARLESTKIQRNYHPGATFAGPHVGWNPEDGLHQVDSDVTNPCSRTMADALRATRGLFDFLRATHPGPLLGAGGEGPRRFDTQWTGVVEAAARPLDEGDRAPLIVDYELRFLNPVMVGFGVGSYPRFFGRNDAVDPRAVDWDAYRAAEVALGRAPYLGALGVQVKPPVPWMPLGSIQGAVTEYYMLSALHRRAVASPVVEIRYRMGAEMVPLAVAAAQGLDFTQVQVWRRHASGLEVWVNRDRRAHWMVRSGGLTYDLPPNGWLALRPSERFVVYSALIAGNRVDVCLSPEYAFLNTRGGTARRIEGITSDGLCALSEGAVDGRLDVLMVGSRSLVLSHEAYRLSERGDLRLRHLAPDEVELCVLDTESGKPVQVNLPVFSPDWQPDRIEVTERADGAWRPRGNAVRPSGPSLQLGRVVPGVLYRLKLAASGGPDRT